jgi:4-aminobutyrate aminotransferase-like enzyme
MNESTPPRPNSPEARDIASVIHPLTNLKAHLEKGPVVVEEGQGVWVTDIHGKRYIEGMAGLWCLSLGYGQERLVEAAAQQMRRLPYYHLTNHKSHSPVIELAEKLLEIAPVPMSKIWFANSGSEGNDSAARIVWYYCTARPITATPSRRPACRACTTTTPRSACRSTGSCTSRRPTITASPKPARARRALRRAWPMIWMR